MVWIPQTEVVNIATIRRCYGGSESKEARLRPSETEPIASAQLLNLASNFAACVDCSCMGWPHKRWRREWNVRTTDYGLSQKQHETTRNNIQCWHVLTTFDHLSIRCKCCRCGAGTAGTSGGNSCVRASARRSRARCHWPDLQVWGPNIVFMSLLSLLKSIYRLDFL